jgi:hypothetical protein
MLSITVLPNGSPKKKKKKKKTEATQWTCATLLSNGWNSQLQWGQAASYMLPSVLIHISSFGSVFCATVCININLNTSHKHMTYAVFFTSSHFVFQILPVCTKLSITRNLPSLFLSQDLLAKLSFHTNEI